MCTVSWCFQPHGYTLFFNRDESRDRLKALPPRWDRLHHTPCLYPCDPQGGGTWLLANEHGITLALLNYYEKELSYQPVRRQSRGGLPLLLAGCRNQAQIHAALKAADLSPYLPLHFLAVDVVGKALLLTWDGTRKRVSHPEQQDLPITTSSYQTSRVIEARHHLYQTEVAGAATPVPAMERFHTGLRPEPASYSVFMTRSDARTVSVSRVEVTDKSIRMEYRTRAENSGSLEPPVSLSLSRG